MTKWKLGQILGSKHYYSYFRSYSFLLFRSYSHFLGLMVFYLFGLLDLVYGLSSRWPTLNLHENWGVFTRPQKLDYKNAKNLNRNFAFFLRIILILKKCWVTKLHNFCLSSSFSTSSSNLNQINFEFFLSSVLVIQLNLS